MTSSTQTRAAGDFAKPIIRALANRGITVIATVLIPDMASPMPNANAEVGYALNDNGTHRIERYNGVLALATR